MASLGGNNAAYVRVDAELEYVASQLVDVAVFNTNQSCCAVERIRVHADVYGKFLKQLHKEICT
ncbi:hypothetical protein PgNI_06562 [Pyricularia grisea]|uniref:Aldehyde dehydrogenase domain-containing protein n=1 Tax=Pyricularia grisea TaxID=148305 RepID=A0A6P8B3Q7_PYRGI|nr:hypothetical protein PgNI_06562 [Pyricularia grisea]TLD09937.1 hypothetical protein PgNI_06562 [Pyricularia grisea]